jgi:single-stranded-DNA-specific exonuclease
VADVVPLLYENRCFVEMGLMLIRAMKHKGLTMLLKSAGVNDFENITSETIAFTIAPMLNAAGRLDTANVALKVLISEDEKELEDSVNTLNRLNLERQSICDDTFREALEMVQNDPNQGNHSIVLFNSTWHIGIIGIVASKLVEYFNKPCSL